MNWPKVQLQDIALGEKGAIVSGPFGSNISAKYFVEEGVPVIRGNNLTKGQTKFIDEGFAYLTEAKAAEFRNCIAVANDLVFTAAGSIGQVGMIPPDSRYERYVISNKQLRVRLDRSKADPIFVYAWLSSPLMVRYLESMNNGGAVPLLNLGIVRRVPVPLPPIETQSKIADILSAYDDLIENNRRRIALLEEAARLLYREWFVHFRFPGHEHVKITDGLPEGWDRRYLGDVVTTQYGHTASASEEKEGPKFVRGTDINKRSFIDWSSVPYCPEQGLDFDKYALVPGDILVIRMADPGKVALVEEPVRAVFASYLVRLKIKNPREIPPTVLFMTLMDERYQGFVGASSGRATRKSASAKLLTDFHFVLPPKNLLQLFVEQVMPLRGMIRNLVDQSASSAQARELLLPRLMNGEIAV